MHESSYPTSGTRSTNSRSTARTSSADFAQRTRAIVPSSRKALSSPFLQHHPLHREQAVRATRPAKPSGSGRRGETECSGFVILRNARKVLRLYVERVPEVGYQNSCIFHGKQGCTLDRSLRSDVCNSYFCGGLQAYMTGDEAVTPTMIIAGV